MASEFTVRTRKLKLIPLITSFFHIKTKYTRSGIPYKTFIKLIVLYFKRLSIRKGSGVLYVDTARQGKKVVKVIKYGIWDGEKVILNDSEKTVVYKKDWLEKSKIVNKIKI